MPKDSCCASYQAVSPVIADNPVGASVGVTLLLVVGVPGPYKFIGVTVTVYAVPFVNPLIVASICPYVVLGATVVVVVAGVVVTEYQIG